MRTVKRIFRRLQPEWEALKDASVKINTGVGKLYDGTKKVRDGAKTLKKGSGDLKSGTKELSDGLISLDKASAKILKRRRQSQKGNRKIK